MRDLTLLPKAHLHVHLESTIRPGTLREIAAANGVQVPDPGRAFDGFHDFAGPKRARRRALRTAADFTRIAREFCADEAAQGTRYAEVTFTAASHGERLGDPELPLAAVLAGLAEGQAAYEIECRVILDHPRKRSVERAWQTQRLAARYADGVVAIGLAGDEHHPVEPFAKVFAAAAEAGTHRVHHAGEEGGPDSIRAALTAGLAERIGHGIRVLDDPALVAELRDRRIPLEVCPSSNVTLGLAPSLAAHPLPRLLAAGLVVTLNTDIPDVTGMTLSAELERVRKTFELDDAALAALNRAAIDASYAPAGTKDRLHRGTSAWLASAG